MSPLAWDIGHIAAFEDLWLCSHLGGLEPLRPELWEVYDAAETPRAGRGELPYLRAGEARGYMRAVRDRTLGVLGRAELGDPDDPRGAAAVWDMVVRHEQQHCETMAQTICLAEPGMYEPIRRPLPTPPTAPPGPARVRVEAGAFLAGAGPAGFAYDNERPRREVHLPAFEIDRLPVTNGDWLEFRDDGGYARRELWTPEGWAWREREAAERPLYWGADGSERFCDLVQAIDPALPVMHVSWFEADAFARWAGRRLPTELEWEKAAAWGPGASSPRTYPWGGAAPTLTRANLDQTGWGPAPAGAYPSGASAYGALGMLGDAWEWTASRFEGYPGFEPFPYEGYSAPFFGGAYRVLRGGSWATRPRATSNSFRNWDLPGRRQIFSGLRLANDA